MIKYMGRNYNGLRMKRIIANSISWLVIATFAITNILWPAPIELSNSNVLVKRDHLRPKSAWNSKGAQDVKKGLESHSAGSARRKVAGSARQKTLSSAKQKAAEIASLVKGLNAKGIRPKVNGRGLSEFITRPPRLLEHIQDYSIIKEPEDIRLILTGMLDVKRGRSPPEEAKVKQLLYNGIFDQDKLPADKPLKVVLFRGGKGAGKFSRLLKKIPNIEITMLLGATDDGRSWFIAARDFNMTGMPDCGKSLLDLAEDDKVAAFLGARMKGGREELAADLDVFIKRLEGDKRVKLSRKAQKLYRLAKKIEKNKQTQLLKYLKKFQKTYPLKSNRFTLDNIPMRSVVLVGAAWYFEGRGVKNYCQKAADEAGRLLDIGRNRVCLAASERQHLMALMKDGTIYFSETGINEDPKHSDFIGLWLMNRKFDIDDKNDPFMMALEKEGIELEGVTIGSNRKRNNGRDINGKRILLKILNEITDTTRRIRDCTDEKLQKAAEIISGLSRTAGKDRIGASPEAKGAIEDADAIIYCPTTLEPNIGSALIIKDIQEAIRKNRKAAKIHFVNMTIENDLSRTKASAMLERLFRYTSSQQGHTHPSLGWSRVGEYVNYIVGKGAEYPNLDRSKTYIKVDADSITETTKGKVRTVTLDLENKEPAMEEAKDYERRIRHWGFNSPLLMKEITVALEKINQLGYYLNEEARLRSSYEDITKGQDVRGDAQEQLTDDMVENLTRAYAFLLKQKVKKANPTVVVGKDVRRHSLRIQKVIIKTLRDMGVNVIDIGKPGPEGSDLNCPTPLLYFAVKHYHADGGINVTASHLEINQNGLKLVFRSKDGIGNITEAELKKLNYMAMAGGFKKPAKKGQVRIRRPLKAYIENMVSLIREALKEEPGIDRERPLTGKKIVVEAGGGTVGFIVQILERLGAEVIGLHLEPDPELKVLVNPDHEETMEELKTKVLEEKADLGIAFDPDGDRVGFITDRGKRVDGNELLTFLSINVLKDHPGSYIVYNNKISAVVEETIRKNGGIPVSWRTGYAFIREKIKELQNQGKIVGFGGEDSAHVMFPENDNFDDGAYTAAKFLIYLLKDAKRRPVSKIIDEFPHRMTFLNLKMPILKLDEKDKILKDKDGKPVIEDDIVTLNSIKTGVAKGLGDYFREQGLPVEDFGLQNPADGARVEFKAKEGWALLRGSLYDPVIEVCLEAKTFPGLYSIIDEILERMNRHPQVDMTNLRNLRRRLKAEEKVYQARKDTVASSKKRQGIKSSSAGKGRSAREHIPQGPAIEGLPKVIFFDMDGVLLRQPANRYEMIAEALFEYGVKISAKEVGKMIHGDKERRGKAMRGTITEQEFMARVNNYLREFGLRKDFTAEGFFKLYFGNREPNKKLLPLLLKLKQSGSIKLGIISDRFIGDPVIMRKKLESAFPGIFDDEDLIFFSCHEHLSKHDIALFERAKDVVKRKFNTKPEEILHIDDNPKIIEVVEAAGLKGLHYAFYDEQPPDLESYPVFRDLLAANPDLEDHSLGNDSASGIKRSSAGIVGEDGFSAFLSLYKGKEPSLSIYRDHVANVTDIAMILAKSLGFSEDETKAIFRASLLHDVGNNYEDRKLRDEITAFARRHNISSTFVGLRKQLRDEGVTITPELEDGLDKVLEDRLRKAGLKITLEIKRHLRLIIYHERCSIEIIKAANIELSALEELLIRYHNYPSELTPENFDRLFPGRFNRREKDGLMTKARRLLSVITTADTIEASSSRIRSMHIPDYHRRVETLEGLFGSLDRKYRRGDINPETCALVNKLILTQDTELLRVIKRSRQLSIDEPLPDFDLETIARRRALLDLVEQGVKVGEDGLLRDRQGRPLDKGKIDFLVDSFVHRRGVMDNPGVALFRDINRAAPGRGYENLSAQSRYGFIRLLTTGDARLIDEATSLTETARQGLKTLFTNRDEITFANISEDILFGLIEEKEGFTGFTDTEPFTGTPRILFIGPAHFPMGKSDVTIRARRLFPHSYRTASFLEQHGMPVDIYDVNLDGWEGLKKIIDERHYDFICFSPSNPVGEADLEMTGYISRMHPDTVLVLGGEGAAFDYHRFLERNKIPAVVIRGFGSKVMLDMAVNYKKRHQAEEIRSYLYNLFRRIPNLYLQDADGRPVPTRLIKQFTQKYLRVVSRLVNYAKIPYEKYWDIDLEKRPSVDFLMTAEERLFYRDTVRIVTKSHCPYNCAFCSYSHFLTASISGRAQPVLALPANDIHVMVRKILDAHPRFRKKGVVFFHDDDLISPETEKMLRFFEAGHGLNEDVVYFGFTRIDRVNGALLKKKYRAGFRKLLYGIETFSDRLLKIMNKIYKTASSAQLAKKVIRSTLKAGIIPVMTLILFYPYANFEDVKITIDETVELTAEGAIPNVYPYAEARAGANLTKEARAGRMEIVGKHIMPVDPELRRLAEESLLKQEEVEKQIRDKYDWRHDFTPAIEAMIFFKAIYQAKKVSTRRIDEVINILVNRYRDELIGNFFEWMKNPEGEKIYSFGEVVSELKRVVSDYRKRMDVYLLNHPGLKDEIFRTEEKIASLTKGEVGERADLWDVYIPLAGEIIQARQSCPNNRITVAVAGPTGVGKGVFADALAVVLQCAAGGREKVGLINMDRFYYSEDRFQELGISDRDRWASEALDTRLLIETISNFRNGARITQPIVVYEKMEGRRDEKAREYRITTGEKEAVAADEILLVDGGYLLYNDSPPCKRLYGQFDRRLFLDAPVELIGEWRIARGLRFGTLSHEEFNANWKNYQVYRAENQRRSMVNADTVFVKGPDHRIRRILKAPLKPPARAHRTKTPIEKGINKIRAIVENFEEPQILIGLKKKRKGDTFSARVKRYLEPYLKDLLSVDWDSLIKPHPRSPEGQAGYLRIREAIAGIEKVVNTFGSLRERRVFYTTSEPKRRITLRTELKDILDSSDFSRDEEHIVAEAKKQCRDLLERIEDETKPILRAIKLLVGRYDVDIKHRAENGIKKAGRKLGILPSSFNPLHKDHIEIAEKAIKELGIDEVVLVMTEHKEALGSTPQDRMDMLKGFARSDSKGVYSAASSETEVLMEIAFDIKQLYPHDTKVFIIIGAASAYTSLSGFYEKEAHLKGLLAVSNLAICNTSVPGRDLEHLKKLPAYQKAQPQIYILNEAKPVGSISSTKVREAVKQGSDITGFVPGEILRIIQERGLYRDNDASPGSSSSFNVKSFSAGEAKGVSTIKVVDLLCGRIEGRFGVKISNDMREELIREFDSRPLSELAEDGFTSFEQAAEDRDREGLKKLVWLEAGLLYYNALPLLSCGGEYVPVEVSINQGAMEQMREARARFKGRPGERIIAQTRQYWEVELPQYRGEVYSFNERPQQKPEISVDIAVMSAGYLHLIKRIEELKGFSRPKDLELVACIADPDNLSQDKWRALKEAIESCGFPVKVVFSKKNTIVTNRNLTSSVSSGEYRIFLDDDVRMVGPVIESLVGVLEEHPEVGVVSVPSYEYSLRTFKPRWHNLKYPLDKKVVITNTILGMAMATRAEIVKALPFVKFWPNNGEDIMFCRQLHKIGFLSAYVMPPESYLLHEAKKNWKNLYDCLVCESLTYYLEAENYDEMIESFSVRWLLKYGEGNPPLKIVQRFWRDFSGRISDYFAGQEDAFKEFLPGGDYDNEWFQGNAAVVRKAIDYFYEHRDAISSFKAGEYAEKDLAKINPFLGLLAYEVQALADAKKEILISAPLAFKDPEELPDAELVQRALKLQESGIDTLHFDIKTKACTDNLPVSGQPNDEIFTPSLIRKLKKAGFKRPIEVHLMDYNTRDSYIRELCEAGASALYIYPDSFTERKNLIGALKLIKEAGMEPGVVLRVKRGVDELSDDILRYSEVVVLTAGREGKKGEPFNPIVAEKSKQLLLERGYQGRIIIQSAIDDKTILIAASGGAVEFVVGSYIKKCEERGEAWEQTIERLRTNAAESRIKFLKAVAQTEGADAAKSQIDLQQRVEKAILEAA